MAPNIEIGRELHPPPPPQHMPFSLFSRYSSMHGKAISLRTLYDSKETIGDMEMRNCQQPESRKPPEIDIFLHV